MEEMLIWVDEQDEAVGCGEKLKTHQLGQLHRAFSVFVFDPSEGTILLQKRAADKYHSGGKWSNACCSHPRRGEGTEEAARARLMEELHLDTKEDPLLYAGKFTYYASFDGLSEHEVDHVFVYFIDEEKKKALRPNPLEAEELCWVTRDRLADWMARELEAFSAWFSQALTLAEQTLMHDGHQQEEGQQIEGK